jgi:hypothetical protein
MASFAQWMGEDDGAALACISVCRRKVVQGPICNFYYSLVSLYFY